MQFVKKKHSASQHLKKYFRSTHFLSSTAGTALTEGASLNYLADLKTLYNSKRRFMFRPTLLNAARPPLADPLVKDSTYVVKTMVTRTQVLFALILIFRIFPRNLKCG